jgi:ABC-type phosphate/phosphonate transport system substrate-binding protein
MYDWPEVASAHDALWAAIADRLADAGIAAPRRLDRSTATESVWRSPGLVLSQTCGYPFVTRLRGAVDLLAVPIYAAEGCEGVCYSSVIVVRRDDPGESIAAFGGRRFAFNSRDSLSGYVALVGHARERGLAEHAVHWVETGSHRAALVAVAEGRADLAAIDAVCWELALRHEAAACRKLRVLDRTRLRSALPFITAAGRPIAEFQAVRDAFLAALASPEMSAARDALCLSGAEAMAEDEYLRGLALADR